MTDPRAELQRLIASPHDAIKEMRAKYRADPMEIDLLADSLPMLPVSDEERKAVELLVRVVRSEATKEEEELFVAMATQGAHKVLEGGLNG